MALSKNGIAALLLGSTAFLGISFFAYFFWFRRPTITNNKKIERKYSYNKTDDDDLNQENDVKDEKENDDNEEEVEAEDVDEEEVEGEENGKTDEEESLVNKDEEDLATIKDKYDEIIRIAKKLMSGNAYLRAAEKFKEAIKLIERIPMLQKDLITLYNNSSAMYEKAGMSLQYACITNKQYLPFPSQLCVFMHV